MIQNQFLKNTIYERNFLLGFIVLTALLIRYSFHNFGLPFTHDDFGYFVFALDISILDNFPNYLISSIGWPIFISIFFQIFSFENLISYMILQENLSIWLSALTAIPIFFLSKKFISKKFAFFPAFLFVIEPRIVLNSVQGLTEPLFLILFTSALVLVLSKSVKLSYVAFVFASFSAIVRPEGLIIILLISILFFYNHKSQKINFIKFFPNIVIIFAIMSPIMIYQMEIYDEELFFSRILDGTNQLITGTGEAEDIVDGKLVPYEFDVNIIHGLQNLFKYGLWVLLPLFFLVPLGLFSVLKRWNYDTLVIFTSLTIISLPVLYVYSNFIESVRFLLIFYPLFSIITTIGIIFIFSKLGFNNKFVIIVALIFLIMSIVFLSIKQENYEHEFEAYNVANFIVQHTSGINSLSSSYTKYIDPIEFNEKWKNDYAVPSIDPFKRQKVLQIIDTSNYDSLNLFISESKSKGLTHLVLDSNSELNSELRDVFNEKNMPEYLTKIHDSAELNYTYHVKIFQINYELLK